MNGVYGIGKEELAVTNKHYDHMTPALDLNGSCSVHLNLNNAITSTKKWNGKSFVLTQKLLNIHQNHAKKIFMQMQQL